MIKYFIAILAAVAVILGVAISLGGQTAPKAQNMTADTMTNDPENTLVMTLSTGGVVTIRLRPDLAPTHVARIKELTREGFHDGTVFHRVIDGFMAQTGDPTGTGTGGSGQKLTAEFSNESFQRGTLGMARAMDPNSGDSQFFICFQNAPHLNGQYTVFGEVTHGMEHVDGLKKGAPGSGAVSGPDSITTLRVAADVEAASE